VCSPMKVCRALTPGAMQACARDIVTWLSKATRLPVLVQQADLQKGRPHTCASSIDRPQTYLEEREKGLAQVCARPRGVRPPWGGLPLPPCGGPAAGTAMLLGGAGGRAIDGASSADRPDSSPRTSTLRLRLLHMLMTDS
jgi:hypothetical protein